MKFRSPLLALLTSLAMTACPTPVETDAGMQTTGGGGGTEATGGGGGTQPTGGGTTGPILTRSNRSTPVQITSNDSVVAMVNQDSDSLSLFSTTSKTRSALLSLGPDTMPVSVAIHPDDSTAFVVARRSRQLLKVTGIETVTPQLSAARATVGAEPTGVALSPTGALALVTNFGEGTVTIIQTADMSVVGTVTVGGAPRAIAITNDLDSEDTDEKAYVTQFFGEATAEVSDTGRTGHVIEITLATQATRDITLAPIEDTGFGIPLADGGVGANVACAPNQLFAIAINAGKAYVTHLCAAPQGPVFKFTNVFAAVSVIDLAAGAEDRGPAGSVALSRLIAAQGTATSNLLGVPVGIDFKPGTNVAYVVSQAGDTVQRVHFRGGTDGRGPIVLGPDAAFAQINTRGAGGIKVPLGIVVANTANVAWVANWAERTVSLIDLSAQALDSDIVSADKPAANTKAAHELAGLKFFFTGTGRWSDRSVSSCGSCHPDGLSDQITWLFAAGPRQTIPLDSTYAKTDPSDQRALNWSAIFDEIHDFELNTRGTSGGKGAIVTGAPPADVAFNLTNGVSFDGGTTVVRNDNLSGSTKHAVTVVSTLKDWDEVDAYVKSIKSYRAPTVATADIAAGRQVFAEANCANCHSGPKWTISRVPYTPSPEKNGSLPGANLVPTVAFGLRTENQPAQLPGISASLNTDTLKVDIERGVAFPDGGVGNVGPERITCVIRNVGTFNGADLREVKADGTPAQGIKGFNPPSLLSLQTGAPYLHHGAAKTLEAIFTTDFATHYQAGNANFLANGGSTPAEQAQVRSLIAFLRSIDETTAPFSVPTNHDLCVND